MKQIARSTTNFYLRDAETGYIAGYTIEKTKKGKLLTTTSTIYQRNDTKLIPVCSFRYETSLRLMDALLQKFRRTVPSLPNMTDADLIAEVRSRNLYDLSSVPDDTIFLEALNRGIVPPGTYQTDTAAEEPVQPVAIVPEYDDASQTDATLIPAPKKRRLIDRLLRRK